MTMLRGYVMPTPGAGDGEYGGFGGYGGMRFAGYAQSPVNHPYWAGQGIAQTIPALNGYSEDMHSQDVLHSHDGFGAMPTLNDALPVVAGALVGHFAAKAFGLPMTLSMVGGGAAGYFFRDKFPKLAGFGAPKMVYLSRRRQRRQDAVDPRASHSGSGGMHGFGLMMGPMRGSTSVDDGGMGPEQGVTAPDSMSTHSDSVGSLGGGVLVIAGLLAVKYFIF